MYTKTPCCFTSSASALDQICRPPLVHPYAAVRGGGIRPLSEPILRMSDLGSRMIMVGSMTRARWRVQSRFWLGSITACAGKFEHTVWRIFSISSASVSANATGISCDAATLLTVIRSRRGLRHT